MCVCVCVRVFVRVFVCVWVCVCVLALQFKSSAAGPIQSPAIPMAADWLLSKRIDINGGYNRMEVMRLDESMAERKWATDGWPAQITCP